LTPRQLFGGDLDGIVERLDHLEALGVDTIYLRPAFEAESNHRYNATSFDAIDPVVGGEQALERLAKAVHDRGMRLIGDITTNHCGDTHEWFRTGRQDAASVERSMFYFDERGGYESWLGVPTLPKLNWSSETTHERMAGVVTRWLGVYDGWRVDVANMTGRRGAEEHTRTVAATLRQVTRHERPDSVLIAEHMFDASDDLDADGWDGIMNYAGFTRPVWTWLGGQSSADIDFLGRPGGIPRASGPSAVASMRTLSASISWQSLVRSWLVLDSFDCARIRSVVGSRERQVVAVGLQATLPGVPMICAGSEWGLLADTGEQGRIPMPWNRPDQRDESVFERYRELFGLRSTEQALRIGGMRWLHVGDDVMVFARETAEETLVVCASRGPAGAVCLPLQGTLEALYAAEDLAPVDGMVELSADGPAVRVWRLRHRVAV
jgi:alpha-glucosidase